MRANAQSIIYQEKEYPTLRAFAEELGLNYPKVTSYHRQGKSAEEIVELCRYQKNKKQCPVFYNGVQYDSLYSAATTLGLNPGQLYDIKKRNNISGEEAIAYLIHKLETKGQQQPRRATPCIVDGVSYPSREAAINAYHMTRITVYSRMEREGISFEEALIRGRKASLYRAPAISLFPSLRLVPAEAPLNHVILDDLLENLLYYNYQVQPMCDLLSNRPALFVSGHSYVYFNPDAHGIEIISELDFQIDDTTIGMLNSSYVAVKLFRNGSGQKVCLLTFQFIKEEKHNLKPLLDAWFAFDSIRDQLLRKFGGQEDQHGRPALNKPEPAIAASLEVEKTATPS